MVCGTYRRRFAGTRSGRAWWTRTRRPRQVPAKRPTWPRHKRRPRTGMWPDTQPWWTSRAPEYGVRPGAASAPAGRPAATDGHPNPPTTCSAPAARPTPASCWGGGPFGRRRLWASWWRAVGDEKTSWDCCRWMQNIATVIFFFYFWIL